MPPVEPWMISNKDCIQVTSVAPKRMKTQDLRKLGNIKKMRKLGEH